MRSTTKPNGEQPKKEDKPVDEPTRLPPIPAAAPSEEPQVDEVESEAVSEEKQSEEAKTKHRDAREPKSSR